MSHGKQFADDTSDGHEPVRWEEDISLPGTTLLPTGKLLASDEQRNCLEREVLRQRTASNLGVRRGQRISGRLDRQISRATDLVLDAAEPDFLCKAYSMKIDEGDLVIGPDVRFRSKALLTGLGWCRQAVTYVATLGPVVDQAIQDAMDHKPDFGLVVDTVASEAAEFLVDEVEQTISGWLLPHEAVSLPFSPGYCDWPVDEQAKLFRLLPDNPVGVSLLPTSLMTPRKSIAGLLGIGLTRLIQDTCNPCKTCPNKCEHRRHRRFFRA